MSEISPKNGSRITTVEDLLAHLQPSVSKNLLSSFRTTIDHISRCLQVPRDQLSVDALMDVDVLVLRSHLEQQRRYTRSSVRSYCKFFSLLIRKTQELKCLIDAPETPEAWKPILEAVTKPGCKDIVRHAIKHRIAPSRFADQDLAAWASTMVARGRTHTTACDLIAIFKRILRNCGLAETFPCLSPLRPPNRYAISVSSFPAQLRNEVEGLLKWKQADFAPGRPNKCRHRAVTAEGLKSTFQQLYGFAAQIKPLLTNPVATSPAERPTIATLRDFVTRETVTAWVEWLINERKVLKETARGNVGLLYGAVRYYPLYAGHDFSWFSVLLGESHAIPDPELRSVSSANMLRTRWSLKSPG
jgi:hypothetical protein